MVAIVACAFLSLCSCAPGYDGARQAITNGETLVIASVGTIKGVDTTYKQQILHDVEQQCKARADVPTCILEEGEKRFADYSAKRDDVVKLVRGANVVLKAAADILPSVEAGLQAASDLWVAVAKIAPVLAVLTQAVVDFGLIAGGK